MTAFLNMSPSLTWFVRLIIIFCLLSEYNMNEIVSVFYNAKASISDNMETSISNGVIRNTTGTTIRCGMHCASESTCYSFIVQSDSMFCQIFDRIQRKLDSPTGMTAAKYYEKVISSCPGNFISAQGMCFKYFSTGMTWNEAQTQCQQLGGYLFHASTSARQFFLQQSLNTGFDFHIGGFKENGNWIWPSGSLLSDGYQNWGPMDPSGDCLKIMVRTTPAPSEWKNIDCNGEKLSFLCEITL